MQTQDTTFTTEIKGWKTFYHRVGGGNGSPIVFLHGSGPGVSAFSNWQFALPALGESHDCIAPDLFGFAQSEHPEDPPHGTKAWVEKWVEQVIGLMDELGIEKTDLVGNSMGGSISLHLVDRHPERFRKVVLMGTVGAPDALTDGLRAGWGFYDDPSKELLEKLVGMFVYDTNSIGGDISAIAEDRWKTVMQDDIRRSFEAMFGGDLEKHTNDLALSEETLRGMEHQFLLTHGREDNYVNMRDSVWLAERIPNAQLHVFDHCGHWIQIEKRVPFNHLVGEYLAGGLD